MTDGKRLRVAIIDMQPITPAVGGGRQRLLGLYHALGENIDATYVGSYDWPGEPPRDQQLTPGLREITIPLSDAHHKAAAEWRDRLDGKVVIDCMFPQQVELSPAYLQAAREAISDANVVVFSHPWAWPALKDAVSSQQLLVYDSHNVESVLRAHILSGAGSAEAVIKLVATTEYSLCQQADLVLTCSHEDRELFARLFDLSYEKLRVVPNGIFAFDVGPASSAEKQALRTELRVTGEHLVVFLGSGYGPNDDAALFIVKVVAPRYPDLQFAIMGGCCGVLDRLVLPGNVRTLGVVEEANKNRWLRAADVALNPLTRGSGTSIKMFDFLARGLPTLATPCGARGIVPSGDAAYRVEPAERIVDALGEMLADRDGLADMARAGRQLALDFYAWERISPGLGRLLRKRYGAKLKPAPYFSVIVPTYERPEHLDRLIQCLATQVEKDFEVIIVDQSPKKWSGYLREWPFTLTYVWTPVRGAVKARNTGGSLASGHAIAFTDDDCEPRPTWLSGARRWFEARDIVGLEGVIRSEHLNDPEWRPVSNVGFEGLGFMTANLFVLNEAFQKLDGFDLAFDNPHFREDTDFGWRLQELGAVPFADDAEVFHPPHRRKLKRESQAERNRFFEKDALLLKKHPHQYKSLFLAEMHWRETDGFWRYFSAGAVKYSVLVPTWMAPYGYPAPTRERCVNTSKRSEV